MTTLIDIAAIRARAEAATEGPWGVDRRSKPRTPSITTWSIWHVDGNHHVLDMDRTGRLPDGFSKRVDADLSFIAASRTDVPALCDRLEELEARIVELEDANRAWAVALKAAQS